MSAKKNVKGNAIVGYKILKNGKTGTGRKFANARIAAEKVAYDGTLILTAQSNIYHALAGDLSSAYGYVWERA